MIFKTMSPETKRNIFQSIPLTVNFWEEFEFDELVENMRQRDDPGFAAILNRIRFGNSTIDDINTGDGFKHTEKFSYHTKKNF